MNATLPDSLPASSAGALPPSIPAMLAAAAHSHGDRPAIVDGTTTLSYAELLQAARRAARSLIAHGIEPGDRVAIWAPNRWEWIVAACGIQAAGAILVPINTRMKGGEAADILARSGARLLFVVGDFLGAYLPAQLDGLRPPTLEQIVVIGEGLREASGARDWPHFLESGAAVPEAAVDARVAALGPDTTADLMFTSGTTGRPKGVMAAHGPTLRAFDVWARVVGLGEGDRYLVINPFFHSFGYKAGWVAALLRGATIYPCAVFDADDVLRRIERDRISFLPGPPTLFLTMLAHPRLREFDLSSLQGAVTGAASVPPVLIERMRSELGIRRVTTAYGLTECGGCATVCDPVDDAQTVATTCGKALPGTELRIADAAGRSVDAGSAGEVLLRGYHVMQGYFEDAAATREAIDAKGWLHTGDVGVVDERGYLRITDRLKDLYISGGFNVYPAEVERLLSPHPAIAQVAVIGVADERLGEVGCAWVVARPGTAIDEAALVAWARGQMANYKVPRRVRVVDALPMNASGKVDKQRLRAQAG
ncbi:MAG: FadD3 family acyl-CoA ligase [Burkholderiales bacterium]|nr:FadD3 family acyl-CoA ligase [Burkholderiales bacterium]MDE1926058.1 FadD3 family acyl-CoA ligase [Burkholderiales bacterium]MDE2157686.1 FadD3 family acyl-CoA ligase [Burkholderiales bacterium]MDE2502068.1 FadD3 family acyl-CoA ligase [Burkholderiales bacterium]